MGKLHVPRKSTAIDMTPMVDMGFLLVTFFMLTTQMRPDEPVIIKKPSSISDYAVPQKNIMIVTVSDSGRAFFDLKGKYFRQTLIQKMGDQYGITFNQDEINTFAVLTMVGVPMAQMKQFLDMDPEVRKNLVQPGIPVDTLGGELTYWIGNARASDPAARITIQGDGNADYSSIKGVINTMQNQNVNRFSLITDKEAAPEDYVPEDKTKK